MSVLAGLVLQTISSSPLRSASRRFLGLEGAIELGPGFLTLEMPNEALHPDADRARDFLIVPLPTFSSRGHAISAPVSRVTPY